MTEKIEKLEALRRPLEFAARNGFAAVGSMRGMERTFGAPLADAARTAGGPARAAIGRMIELTSGLDGCPVEEKRSRLAEFKTIFDGLTSGAPFPEPPPAAGLQGSAQSRRLDPSTPVKYVKGVGPVLSERLAARGIVTVLDALRFYPRAYEDRRNLGRIIDLKDGTAATVAGTVVARGPAGRRAWEMVIRDQTGYLSLKWFHFSRPFLERLRDEFSPGDRVVASGKVSRYAGRPQIVHPELRKGGAFEEDNLNYRRIIPLYPRIEGVTEGHFLRIMQRVVEGCAPYLEETLPESLRRLRGLHAIGRAFAEVHFPPEDASMEGLETTRSAPRRRLLYEECFLLQAGLAMRKERAGAAPGIAFRTDADPAAAVSGLFPFELTRAQMRAINEIAADMARPSPMNRLLQGDVGSGKTAVAFAAMTTAVRNGHQCAMLAPTEILAVQHFASVSRYAETAGRTGISVRAALLTGSTKESERGAILAGAADGKINALVGTHAVLEDEVAFKRLGLAVIDEQHRFGVVQRAAIRRKGRNPDILVMTATPIPRTLAMSLYGDLDLSVIDELPPGRTPVETRVFYDGQQKRCHEIMDREMQAGRQCYVVYPLVEESEKTDLKDATRMAGEFAGRIFPGRRTALLHGRLKDREKNEVMAEFKAGRIDILVSTTVVEVGVDVPNATVMVVEHAERFGLSQLHQLRGRVGRGSARSFCLLVARYRRSEEAERRLRVMEKTNDGFVIAEEDLEIRGPGEFTGTRQSGLPDIMMSGLRFDSQILSAAREDAFALVRTDPDLRKPEHRPLRERIFSAWGNTLDLANIG